MPSPTGTDLQVKRMLDGRYRAKFEENMNDNVIILGAGSSVDAGIPLLSNFVQTMWEIASRMKFNGVPLKDEDCTIFQNAIKVRDELDHYHGRANFDDRNIEDILSILTFNLYENKSSDLNRMNWIIRAIERTIELSCNVKFDESKNQVQEEGNSIYREFWQALLKYDSNHIPTIISFNYDLVLERALFQLFKNWNYEVNSKFNDKYISINYFFKNLKKLTYKIRYQEYTTSDFRINNRGSTIEQANREEADICINLLKLHGSLCFSKENDEIIYPTRCANKPYILPPVFNKNTSKLIEPVWKEALVSLRNAKNVIFVGYSLPQTDIYMQYFLKSGLGPNNNLNNIFVFDQVFNKHADASIKMEERYKNCFSPQIHNRIYFVPPTKNSRYDNSGSFEHFVDILKGAPSELLF